ncbi:MAG TPA: TetR/AcrR family transcriptional regulator [Rhizomicrobium sp.]|jgi:AcrR family transcriptional regulator|nr:TetR/AcrR family transcriptional regulator [Rhizomicrobium sp.]
MPRTLTNTEVEDFRDRLCDVAAGLFETRGRDGFTMRELAAKLGVSAMTAYRYFRDKDAILAAIRARAFNRFAQALEEACARPGDAAARANAAGEAYIRFALDDPTSYKLMFDLSQDDANYPELAKAAERARHTMTRHVHPLVEQGLLAGDPDLIGHVFWAILHGALMLKFAGKLDSNFRAVLDEALRALVSGLQPRNAGR